MISYQLARLSEPFFVSVSSGFSPKSSALSTSWSSARAGADAAAAGGELAGGDVGWVTAAGDEAAVTGVDAGADISQANSGPPLGRLTRPVGPFSQVVIPLVKTVQLSACRHTSSPPVVCWTVLPLCGSCVSLLTHSPTICGILSRSALNPATNWHSAARTGTGLANQRAVMALSPSSATTTRCQPRLS